jgi:hypothetical protein
MKRTINVAAIFALLFAIGTFSADAQTKKKPVLKRPVAKKPVPRPVTPMYKVDLGTVVRARMNSTISSKTTKAGSTFTTTITEPVYSSTGVVVIPVGSTMTGRIDSVKPSRKGGNVGEIDVTFISVRLPNGRLQTINGSLTELDSKSSKSNDEGTASGDKTSNRKVKFIGGGGAGGAIIGAAVGGGKGALIGGIIGGVGGLIAETQTKGEEATVKSGTEFGVYINRAFSMPRFVEMTP